MNEKWNHIRRTPEFYRNPPINAAIYLHFSTLSEDIQKYAKYARGNFDSYRFNISIHSYLKMNEDTLKLKERFPTCNLAHKQKVFDKWITYKNQINSSVLLHS